MEYFEIYKKRLNRYGLDYQSRVQGQRNRNFDDYLLKSIYRVDFWYNDTFVPATLERFSQDHTETQCYLLTRRELNIPNGTVLMIQSKDGSAKPWMVWWKEEIEASGYNKYVVLKMSHLLTWRDAENSECAQWAYFQGPGTDAISNAIKSSAGEAIYKENNNLHIFITPYNASFVRDMYFEVSYEDTKNGYVITEMDVNSTPGVAYISVDPTYIRKISEEERQTAANFWLAGGNK